MNRSALAKIAEETVACVERGEYPFNGGVVNFADAVQTCVEGTKFYPPDELTRLREQVLAQPAERSETAFEVVNETTLQGVARLLAASPAPVAALNFASAKNPGGGFLGGSPAQEESIARSSALYASLLRAPEYYERHRKQSSALYSDAVIWSPACPIVRSDAGDFLDRPLLASIITSPAPNAGAIAQNSPEELPRIPEVFRQRVELVLALAAAQHCRRLVLGAWGCGVFRNDPVMVAQTFADHLRRGAWMGRFERVVFSVYDPRPPFAIYEAFVNALA